MKPSMTGRLRRHIEPVDRYCGRCSDGLTAVVIVLAIIVTLLGAFRSAQAVRLPEGFEIVGTT
jgi:hypothetical protein